MAVQRLNRCASQMHQQRKRIKCTTIPQMKKCMYTGNVERNIARSGSDCRYRCKARKVNQKYYDPNVNTATDAVIGTRTVDGKAYALTDILNQMAEAIKKIAGDANFTNNQAEH